MSRSVIYTTFYTDSIAISTGYYYIYYMGTNLMVVFSSVTWLQKQSRRNLTLQNVPQPKRFEKHCLENLLKKEAVECTCEV